MFNPNANNQIFATSLNEKNQLHTYDISTLVSTIQYTTVLEGQAGKLTFQLEKDPNGILNMYNGSIVQFYRDGKGIFYGYVFNMGTDAKEAYQIVAYDQMRYLKNEDTLYYSGKTVSNVFDDICTRHRLNKRKIVTPCNFVCPNKKYEGQTLFNILKHQIQQGNIASKGTKYYFIRDNFGTLEFNELGNCKTNVVIGEKSLLSSFQYEISIDKNTYNEIKIVKNYQSEDVKGKKSDDKIIVPYTVRDSGTQKRWGFLQKVVSVDDNMNSAQIIEYGNNLMKQLNLETKSFKLSALGVDGINAGNSIRVNIPQLNTYKKDKNGNLTKEYLDMWIIGATHTYSKGMHTMELDVASVF